MFFDHACGILHPASRSQTESWNRLCLPWNTDTVAFVTKTDPPNSPLLLKGCNLIVTGTEGLALKLYLFCKCPFFTLIECLFGENDVVCGGGLKT